MRTLWRTAPTGRRASGHPPQPGSHRV